MLITDQVATAPCTDPTQVRFLTFEAKQHQLKKKFVLLCDEMTVEAKPYGYSPSDQETP